MRIMGCRADGLRSTLEVLEQTGVPLVCRDGNGQLRSVSYLGDDLGIYYFIPRLATAAGWPLETAVEAFFGGIVVLATLAAIAGGLLLGERWPARLIYAAAALHFARYFQTFTDVYVVPAAAALALAPWLVWACRRQRLSWTVGVVLALAGLAAGVAHLLRNHAGTPLLLLACTMLAGGCSMPRRQRAAAIGVLALAWWAPQLAFSELARQRDAYLAAHGAAETVTADRHAFWHAVYIGLAYTNNAYVPEYRDELAAAVARTAPTYDGYLTPEYERILRGEVVELWRQDRRFVETTIFAKLGVAAYTVLVFAHVGLLAAWWFRKPPEVEAGFWLAMSFASLYGVLVMPLETYLLGLAALATAYGGVSLVHAADQLWPAHRRWAAVATLGVVVVAGYLSVSTTRRMVREFSAQWDVARREAGDRTLLADAAAGRLRAARSLELADLSFAPADAGAVVEPSAAALRIRANAVNAGYQAAARVEVGDAQAMSLAVSGELPRGCMGVGVLDSQGRWIVYRPLGNGPHFAERLLLPVAGQHSVQVILANQQTPEDLAAGAAPSECVLSSCRIELIRR